jgi:pimeloyl-ACP methyl ester carboxylesterase
MAEPTPETRDAVLERPGALLSYEVHDGSTPTIVGLHGLSSSRANEAKDGYFDWSALTASGRRIVRYDARGHGRSTGRAEPADYTWSRLADDLLALLEVVSPDEPVDAFGVSMGTGTLLHAVTKRPERFRRLALVIPPTAWQTRAAQADTYRQMAALIEEHGTETLLRTMAAAPPLPILAAGGWTTLTPPDIDDSIAPSVMRGSAGTDLPGAEAIAGIRQPVLLCPWTDDPAHPLSSSEQLASLLPNATMRVTRTPDDLRTLGTHLAAFFG